MLGNSASTFRLLLVKFGTFFPYTAKVCFSGHHYAQRQAQKAGIDFVALENLDTEIDRLIERERLAA